jgi:hypothetical protein
VMYLAEAPQVTGEVLHVDGGAHNGKWYSESRFRFQFWPRSGVSPPGVRRDGQWHTDLSARST